MIVMRNFTPPPTGTKKVGRSKTGIRNLRPLLSVTAGFISLLAMAAHAAPRHVYLTWQGDTSRTITVNYQTLEPTDASTVLYDTKPRNGRPG